MATGNSGLALWLHLKLTCSSLMEIARELRYRQLVKREETAIGERYLSMHRSLQWSILHFIAQDPPRRKFVFDQAFTLIRQIVPYDPDAPSTCPASLYPLFEVMVPQVLSLHQHVNEPPPPLDRTLEFATLLRDIGTYLNRSGGWVECRYTMQSCDSILNEIGHDRNAWIRTDVEADLGIGYEWVGISKRDQMMNHYRRSLAIRQALVDDLPLEEVAQSMDIILWTG